MSVYNETTVPYDKHNGNKSLKFDIPTKNELTISKPFMSKMKDLILLKNVKSEIPLYASNGDIDEKPERCNSTVCTILNYAVLATCSVLFLGLIAYYSYVGYRSSTKI